MSAETNALARLLEELESNQFFGSVEVTYRAGRVVYIKKTQTLKPEDLNRRDNRGPYERNQSR